MNIFHFRNRLIDHYADYVQSFIKIRDPRIRKEVDDQISNGLLWPDVLIQLNPNFEPGKHISELVAEGVLHSECGKIFRVGKSKSDPVGKDLRLHKHQEEAIRCAGTRENYVLTTGTGSGKSLAYIVPIVDHVLRKGPGQGIQAIVVYPMNALANSQKGELEKFLCLGYGNKPPVTFERYTGQERGEERQRILTSPPDILLTNYVMLELILTRPAELQLITAAQGVRFLVLDELHTYRGRQGADVAMLARRVKNRLNSKDLVLVGTSATMGGSGSVASQKEEVSQVASQLFGSEVKPENVIGETLRRATDAVQLNDPGFQATLKVAVDNAEKPLPEDFGAFCQHPLAAWVEDTFGLTREEDTGLLVRAKARTVTGDRGAARKLEADTGLPVDHCQKAIEDALLAGFQCPNPETGFPTFAFRLHQFISRGGTVYATLEPEAERHVTVFGQTYVPGDRSKVLLPLVFCRECGQEYYCVSRVDGEDDGHVHFEPRDLGVRLTEEDQEAGFIFLNTESPWPDDPEEIISRLPDDWVEEFSGGVRVRRARRKSLPRELTVSTAGVIAEDGGRAHFVGAPFRFCMACGVSYDFRQRSDIAKLTTLGTEGRSTATTILSMFTILGLKEEDLVKKARKLLSFTDNRQDASLQAGHFNDFIEIGVQRSALYRAVLDAADGGMTHDQLTEEIFKVLDLPFGLYASNPDVKGLARQATEKALREVIGYRIYRDLKRGWRIIMPNLEQCGLLQIEYLDIATLAADEDVWGNLHPALAGAAPETRESIARTLLDFLRRGLAIKVGYLDENAQDRIRQNSLQRLIEPWGLEEEERMEHAAVALPRATRKGDYRGNIFISARGGYGTYLRRPGTLPEGASLNLEGTQQVIEDIFRALTTYGLTEVVREPSKDGDVPGYQLMAGAMLWMPGDGTVPFHDPIRVPNVSSEGGQVNEFFVRYYRTIALQALGTHAKEHTAQIPSDERQKREEEFRSGELPILYCSPTMELGIDISELNIVNMRNVPPTPANYAQRSGRAGRSGQPALVFSYCTIGNSHDQYFFKRPELMVSGSVNPPRVDLTNEDLLQSHIGAVWLAETGLSLGKNLADILSLETDEPTMELQAHVRNSIENSNARTHAKQRAADIIANFESELKATDWWDDDWLNRVLDNIAEDFDRRCERWRALYRAALNQTKQCNRIIQDASRLHQDKKQAERLRAEAEAQLKLLVDEGKVYQSDFYSYRYFASEGFLPGYNFPRLPISAYIPGRQRTRGNNEFLSRSRFLAISEFGPQAIIYHAGSKYQIKRVILPVRESDDEGPTVRQVKLCSRCGYLHPIEADDTLDNCERCGHGLSAPLNQLFRMENVVTFRREKINSDEEERFRMGFEIRTGVRFPVRGGEPSYRTARVEIDGTELATLYYGHAATLWRINVGWRQRSKSAPLGFDLNLETGRWEKNPQIDDNEAPDAPGGRHERVIPYVDDRRNCLLIEPAQSLNLQQMASLQAALKNGIQLAFQLEDRELAAEPLPKAADRRLILFYEAAEGGAGALRRLIDDADALAAVAREALQLCHFDPDTGDDLRRPPNAREDCEAACYECLMSYTNQRDHRELDRHEILGFLSDLTKAQVRASPGRLTRGEHVQNLLRLCESDLEKDWVQLVDGKNLRLPSNAQTLVEECSTRPDFLYSENKIAIYVDGRHHDFPERRARDRDQIEDMENHGFTVIRFRYDHNWDTIFEKYAFVFGKESS